jgi:hypothetical protein
VLAMNQKNWEEANRLLQNGTVPQLKAFLTKHSKMTLPKKMNKPFFLDLIRELMTEIPPKKPTTKKSTVKKSTAKKEARQSVDKNPYQHTVNELKVWLRQKGVELPKKGVKKDYIELVFAQNSKHHSYIPETKSPSQVKQEVHIEKETRVEKETLEYWPNLSWTKQDYKSWLTKHNIELPTDDKPKEYYVDLFDNYLENYRFKIWFVGFEHSIEKNLVASLLAQNRVHFHILRSDHPENVDFIIYAANQVGNLTKLRQHISSSGELMTWSQFAKNVL